MILKILLIIFFFSAFIVFATLGYKQRNLLHQFVAVNSFIVGSNCLKEILSSNYGDSINTLRIIIGLLVISIFIHYNLPNKKVTN